MRCDLGGSRDEIDALRGRRRAHLQRDQLSLQRLKRSGECFLSNVVLDGRFWLRACIVNFRTDRADLEAMLESVKAHGRELLSPGGGP